MPQWKPGSEVERVIKGVRRQMVQIRTPESRYFEEAHLVLRREGRSVQCSEGDMVKEASRILEEADRGLRTGRHGKRKWIPWLLGSLFGVFFGAGTVGVIWLLIAFF